MKTFTKFLASLVLAVVMLPAVASAQLVVSQGGTGLTSVTANNILYGVSSSLRLGSEAAFQYNPSTNRFTVDYASTTGFSATNGDLSKLTVTYASSTGFTATNATIGTATGTNLYGFGLPGAGCNGAGQALTWASGLFGCSTITTAGDGVSNWLYNGSRLTPSTTVGIGVFASSTIGDGTGAGGLTVSGNATTTNLKVTGLTASRAVFTGADNLFTTTGTSAFLSNSLSDETGTGIAVFATNPLLSGFRSSASSTIGGGTGVEGLTVNGNATTTGTTTLLAGLIIPTGSATNPAISFLNDADTGMYTTGANSLAFAVGGSSILSLGGSVTPNADVVALNGNSFKLEVTDGIPSAPTFSFRNDTDTGIFNPSGADTLGFTVGGTVTGSTTPAGWVFTNATTTNATSSTSFFSALGTFTNLFGTNALLTNGTTTNASSTNLFATNATIASLVATNATSTTLAVTTTFNFLGDIITNVGTWFSEKLNAVSAFVAAASSTWDFGGAASLEIPNGTNPTVDTTGELALDTTDNQLIIATSTTNAVVRTHDEIYKYAIPSTSPAFATGTQKYLARITDGYTVEEVWCGVEGGTSKIINILGSNITCTTGNGATTTPLITTVGAGSTTVGVTASTTVGVVNWLNVTITGYWTRE